MIHFKLERNKQFADCCTGVLSNDVNPYTFMTLERPDDGKNAHGTSAILPGTYDLSLTLMPRFNKVLPLLLKVPGRDGIFMHVGNTAKDSEGCILVGMTRDKNFIGESRRAVEELMKLIHSVSGEQALGLVGTITISQNY
jgi:hypothetical protein